MGTGSATAAQALALAALLLACSGVAVVTAQDIERIQGTTRPRPSACFVVLSFSSSCPLLSVSLLQPP
jgi:hypothetical protein